MYGATRPGKTPEKDPKPPPAAELEKATAAALPDWLDAQRAVTMPDGSLKVEVLNNWLADVPDKPALTAAQLGQ